jgi:hypothetical protein
MTLDQFRQADAQLHAQLSQLMLGPVEPGKETLQHCNAIEIRGALQLLKQFIAIEEAERAAPPGATGPNL